MREVDVLGRGEDLGGHGPKPLGGDLLHHIRIEVGELGGRTGGSGDHARSHRQLLRDPPGHLPEGSQLQAPRIDQVRRRPAQQILFDQRGGPRQQPPHLELKQDGADGHEPRRLLQGPAFDSLQALAEEPIGDPSHRDVAHVHPLVEDHVGQQAERAREQRQLDGEPRGHAHPGTDAETTGGRRAPVPAVR